MAGGAAASCEAQFDAHASRVQGTLDRAGIAWAFPPRTFTDPCTGEVTRAFSRRLVAGGALYREQEFPVSGTLTYLHQSTVTPEPLQQHADPGTVVGIAEFRFAYLCADGSLAMERGHANDVPSDVGEADTNPNVEDFGGDAFLSIAQMACMSP